MKEELLIIRKSHKDFNLTAKREKGEANGYLNSSFAPMECRQIQSNIGGQGIQVEGKIMLKFLHQLQSWLLSEFLWPLHLCMAGIYSN